MGDGALPGLAPLPDAGVVMGDPQHGGGLMELLIPLGLLVVWLVLQAWVLPRLGVPT